MTKDDRAAAVQPDDEIARRVHRYERGLCIVLRTRREEERTRPISNEEHLLAAQIAEAITAYERGLRHPPLPAKVKEEGMEAPSRPAKAPRTPPRPARRRGGRPRRQQPAPAASAEA